MPPLSLGIRKLVNASYIGQSAMRDIDQRDEDRSKTAQRAASAIALLHGKWTSGILLTMAGDPIRISELLRCFPLASKKMVIESLHHLESRGLIRRLDLSRSVRHVQYHLADEISEETVALLLALANWLPAFSNHNRS